MIFTTIDGTTWTPVSGLPANNTDLRSAACPSGGGLLCAAVGYTPNPNDQAAIFTTTDGTTWTSVSDLPTNTVFPGVACPNGGGLLCVAVGYAFPNSNDQAAIFTTTDGTTWTPVSGLPAVNNLPGVACPNGDGLLCVAVGYSTSDQAVILVSSTVTSSDTTPPVLSLPGTMTVDATSPQGAVVSYTVTATDPDNQPNQLTITCSPASGSTFPIGTTTVNCQASDPAGNTATGSFQVVVKGATAQISDLINLVDSFHLSPQGIQTSFDSQLQAVQADLTAHDTAQACSDLTTFISHVNAQSGKKLTTDQAAQLIAAAQRIQGVLGC